MPDIVMFLVTTDPAPMTTSSTILTGMIVALEPIDNPVADHRLAPQLLASTCRAAGGERVVDEHHPVSDETILADGNELADEGMRLHPCARPDDDALLDFCEGADEAVVAELAAIEVAGLNDLDAFAEGDIAHAGLMHLRPVHETTPSRLSRGVKRSATSSPVSIDS
ncbi:hypothetical protein AB7M50_002881 [Bradyrhizobium elkanii]